MLKRQITFTMTFALLFQVLSACSQSVVSSPVKFVLDQHTDMNAGNGLIHPQRFSIMLPPGLRTKQLISYAYSVFHYADGQRIIVVMHPTAPAREKQQDSTWIPDQAYMRHHVNMMAEVKDEKPYLPIAGRKSEVYRKQGNEIILLNVKAASYRQFLNAVNTFSILPDSTPIVRPLPAGN